MTVHFDGERRVALHPPAGLLDLEAFHDVVVDAYNRGTAELSLPADEAVARSLIPPGTGLFRDFSYIAPDIPEYDAAKCVACMECVTECPDTAILGKVVAPGVLDAALDAQPEADRDPLRGDWARTKKFWDTYDKKAPGSGGLFGIYIDPTKCKGCGECVEVCGDHDALRMVPKRDGTLATYQRKIDFYRALPETPPEFINERLLSDLMLAERAMLYVGGAGSCMGCGE
ncbi:MAG: 4Fe-4S binding protein, partial [Planctomycetes bacterium]|nr:4Fe-4S binding protein [Planctomycetota bacterium]